MKQTELVKNSRYRTLYPHLMIETKIRMGHGSEKLLNGKPFCLYSLIKALTNVDCDTHDEEKRRGIEVGASAYMVKSSFDQGKLLETVRTLMH